jgi:preprotein translocase subunit Sec61beta
MEKEKKKLAPIDYIIHIGMAVNLIVIILLLYYYFSH